MPDSFPDINVLLSYTNPIISTTDTGMHCTHTLPQWEREPDLGKLAHICELHFEWGLKDIIIKRFRTIVWPSIVLRMLRRSALESFAKHESHAERNQDVLGTPSRLLPQHLSSMGFRAHNTGGDGDSNLQDLIVKIHSSRMHAYTDRILEYCIEVAPAQLVHLASAGIHGFRKPADTTYDVLPLESEDESSNRDPDVGDMSRRRKKRSTGPPEPDSHLRMWMPACMVRPALPELVERSEAGLEAKHAKISKGKQWAPPAMKAKTKLPSKRKAIKPLLPPVDSDAEEFGLDVSYSSDDEEGGGGGSSPPQKTHVHAALPVGLLCHSQLPKSIHKCPTQEDYILDITTSNDDDALGPFERENHPLSSPSKVLQRLDGNLCSVPLPVPPSASSPARERPAPTSSLRPFPIAFEGEGSSDDSFSNDKKGYSNYSLQTPFTFCAQLRASTPPPPPRHLVVPQEEEGASSDDNDMMITGDLPMLIDTRALSPERAMSHQTSPRRRPLQHCPFPSPQPPAKKARKGGSDEGRVPHAETSIISISSGGSDDSSDGLGLAPSLVARLSTVSQRVATTSQDVYHEVIDLT